MQKKKGISLIVLVITIIVMIILAASVVISLANNGIIDKAGEAVDVTDVNQVQNLAALVWAESYIGRLEDPTIDLEQVVKQALIDAGVNLDNYDVVVSNTGVTVSKKQAVIKLDTPIAEDGADHHEVQITYDGPATKFNVYVDGIYCESIEKTGTVTTAKVQELVARYPYNCGSYSVEISAAPDGLTGYVESDKVEVNVTFCDD